MKKILLILFILLVIMPTTSFSDTFYVRDDAEDNSGNGSANDVANAFSLEAWETHLEATADPGDVYYVREGTYTLDGDTAINTARDGNDTAGWISIIGFDSANDGTPSDGVDKGDWANAPLITATSNAFTFDNFWKVENFDITITDNSGLGLGDDCIAINNRIVQSNGAASRNAISAGQRCGIIGNDLVATNGRGVDIQNECRILFNYFHDSDIGVNSNHNSSAVVFNVFDTMKTRGIVLGGTRQNTLILNNTMYGANDADAVAIYKDGTASREIIMQNIIQDWYDGINQTTAPVTGYADFNNYYSNSNADAVNWTKGANALAVDAEFTTPGSDFSLQSTSDLINAGIELLGTN